MQHVRILGAGLRSVEYVTGRLTTGRATWLGAGSGAWIGLFSGLLFALGERDFSSFQAMEAARYEVYADAGVADEARRLSAGW